MDFAEEPELMASAVVSIAAFAMATVSGQRDGHIWLGLCAAWPMRIQPE